MMRPAVSRDTAFFWEGVKAHELRIQRLADGSLQHPPVPAVWQDKADPIDYAVACGKGTVFSFVVHHAPKVPGRTLAVRHRFGGARRGRSACLASCATSTTTTVKIGMPVHATYIDFPAGDCRAGVDPLRLGA